jgi:hypothetical protein
VGRVAKLGLIPAVVGAVVAFPGIASAASAGETCKLAMAQLLYRPSTDFRSSTVSESKGRVSFESSFDQSERSIECDIVGSKLTWLVTDEKWRRRRDTPADDQISILKSGIPTITREYADLMQWREDFKISPQGITYLVKMMMTVNKLRRVDSLSWMDSITGALTKTGGNVDQAFHCAFWGATLLQNESVNYEIMKLDIEECFPAGINAVAVGAGVTDQEIIRMMLSNRLASKSSLGQLGAVYDLRAQNIHKRVYSDYFRYEKEISYP